MATPPRVPANSRVPLPNGLQDGSCIEVPLVYQGGGDFQIELRSGGFVGNVSCGYSDYDLIHMHVLLGNPPSLPRALSGAMSNFDGKGFTYRMGHTFFLDPTSGKKGEHFLVKMCAVNERFEVSIDGVLSKRVLQWWDIADIRCINIKGWDRVTVGDIALSNMPQAPAKRSCTFSRCEGNVAVPPAQPFQAIDHALYINLERRNDRREAVERALRAAGIPMLRVDAFDTQKHPHLLEGCWGDNSTASLKQCAGQIGCQRSHLKAIERAMREEWPYVAIFEDDFAWQSWVDPSKVGEMVSRLMNKYKDWDVIGLSLRIFETEAAGTLDMACQGNARCRVSRVLHAQAPGGYILRNTIYKQVHHRFSEEYCNVRLNYQMMTDYCWKGLQHYYNFYSFEPQIGRQAAGFSDIEHAKLDKGPHLYGFK